MNQQRVLFLFRSSILLSIGIFSLISAFIPSIAYALDAPRDVRGTVVRPTDIKWEWAGVAGAVQYQVDVNGSFVSMTNDTYFYSRNLSSGNYTFTVQAVDNNDHYSSPSEQSAAVTIGGDNTSNDNTTIENDTGSDASVDLPTNVRGTQVGNQDIRWEWTKTPGATGYQVYLDGAPAGVTSEDFLLTSNLSSGDHSIGVAAIDSQGRQTDQALSPVVSINGNSNNNNNGVAPPPPANDTGLIDPASWNYPEVFQKPGYELVFSDEFNNSTLNPARWHTQLRWDGEFNGDRFEYRVINGENQLYVNPFSQDQEHLDKVVPVYNPFQFDGQRLAIRAVKNTLKRNDFNQNAGNNDASFYANNKFSYGRLSDVAPQQAFLSGAISTHNKFAPKYGYFEARIKIPNHLGTFPAFWLNHQRKRIEGDTSRTEIDIMENLGHQPRYVYTAHHYYTGVSATNSGQWRAIEPSPYGQIGNKDTGIDYSLNYHVYAAEWTEGLVRFFIDGQQVSEVRSGSVDREPLYMVLNLAIGGNWTNMPTSSGGTGRAGEGNPFPSQQDINEWGNPALEIDYVRAYQRK